MTNSDLAKSIEHTLLQPHTSSEAARKIAEEALEHGFLAVCIPPLFCRDVRRVLGEAGKIRLATVVGFPMGYSAIAAKTEEIKRAVDEGADDIDAVINLAAVKSGQWNHVEHDIDSMARATHMRGRQLKLILECGLLSDDEIARLCKFAAEIGAAYVKTSTGMFNQPTTVEMVKKLRMHSPAQLKIKASGGIRDRQTALDLLAAGAHSIGTSSAIQIMQTN
jgi:deoxyribose-phosphate aldolase